MKKLLICGFILVGCQAVAEPVIENQPKKLKDFSKCYSSDVYISEQDGYRFFIFETNRGLAVVLHPEDQIKINRNW